MKYFLFKFLTTLLFISIFASSCSRKVGCPSNGKNVGAERLMSGEKVPHAKKFKA